jgi:hypothetical protein
MIGKEKLEELVSSTLNRLCKWRSVFACWQLGTRLDTDPEYQAVRDHREVTILLRVENNAILNLLLKKGVITEEEYSMVLLEEVQHLDEAFMKRFPGFEAANDGMHIDVQKALNTMKGWKP